MEPIPRVEISSNKSYASSSDRLSSLRDFSDSQGTLRPSWLRLMDHPDIYSHMGFWGNLNSKPATRLTPNTQFTNPFTVSRIDSTDFSHIKTDIESKDGYKNTSDSSGSWTLETSQKPTPHRRRNAIFIFLLTVAFFGIIALATTTALYSITNTDSDALKSTLGNSGNITGEDTSKAVIGIDTSTFSTAAVSSTHMVDEGSILTLDHSYFPISSSYPSVESSSVINIVHTDYLPDVVDIGQKTMVPQGPFVISSSEMWISDSMVETNTPSFITDMTHYTLP
ncbi:hypothetical protein LOTGIDRAFT_165322 [Lottia gigantea]|uniref:Uncharacterized protein n=1 Tax=Lottia gigantea TaxID=225164 RepID=V4A0T6_LOTGI|nr:hypothetical protein LOTGIDRAFT_165322 [Lottia gigantea]ESO88540.1 hypothetical protein LOTGIDRAFT_165322 [Lottia gigantea]